MNDIIGELALLLGLSAENMSDTTMPSTKSSQQSAPSLPLTRHPKNQQPVKKSLQDTIPFDDDFEDF